MYSLSRLMLTLAVALLAYCTVLAAILAVLQVPPDKQGLAWAILAVCVIAVIAPEGPPAVHFRRHRSMGDKRRA